MTALTKPITAVLLLLSTAGLHADARVGSLAIETLLKNVVVGHYHAIAENRLEEAVRFYHSGSPEVTRIRTAIGLGQAAYLQKTATLSFEFIGQRHDLAFGKARHRFLRIAGLKFFEEFVDVSYVFRKEGRVWKLWMAHRLTDNVLRKTYKTSFTSSRYIPSAATGSLWNAMVANCCYFCRS